MKEEDRFRLEESEVSKEETWAEEAEFDEEGILELEKDFWVEEPEIEE